MIRSADYYNNTSHSGTASKMEAIITDKGKEKEEEQPVNLKVRGGGGNNQHPAYPDKNKLTRLTVVLDVN